jgi:hypothetical protein
MTDIVTAIDESGANDAFGLAIAAVPQQSASGSSSLGPFTAGYAATATFQGGGVDLIPSDTIRIARVRMNWTLKITLTIDLNKILPQICFPQICIKIWKWKICTPAWCIKWPVITIPVHFSDVLLFSADFRPEVHLVGGMWQVKATLIALPLLQFGPPSALILAAIGVAVVPILLAAPFIGPFIAIAVAAILAGIGVAGLTGFLGPILTPFFSGMTFMVYERPQRIELLPYESAIDPDVDITIESVEVYIAFDQEDELIVKLETKP